MRNNLRFFSDNTFALDMPYARFLAGNPTERRAADPPGPVGPPRTGPRRDADEPKAVRGRTTRAAFSVGPAEGCSRQ